MPLVTITGNVWDHTGSPIPAERMPQFGFRPNTSNLVSGGLAAKVEAFATLNYATGAFSCELVAEPWITYTPWLRWLINPGEPDPEDWAYGYAEWSWTVNPYPNGGMISDLAGVDLSIYSVLVSLSPPPPGYKGWYLNAPGPGQPLGDPDDPASSGTGILEIVS